MKFVYLTSKKYPSRTADHFFVKEMALAFANLLKDDFLLVLAGDSSDFFGGVKVFKTGLNHERGRTLYYFFWLPFFIIKREYNSPDSVFFSNDPNLLVNLILLKKIFRFKYKICSEWHMLFDDWRDRFIAGGSDFLVATSAKLRDMIFNRTRVKIDPGKFLVVYGGVNIEKYEALEGRDLRRELGLPKNKILAAYIGLFKTLGARKGIDTMVGALKFLPENFNMVFVGGRREEIDEYKKIITDDKLLVRCIFVERQETEKVPLFEKAVDVLVIPSPDKPPFNNYLLPMKVYEYLASRKPIIYSRLPILEEILSDCGFGFSPDDLDDLAEKILAATNSGSSEVGQKVERCFAKARQSSWRERARKIIDFLTQ